MTGKFLCSAELLRSRKQIRQRRIKFWWGHLYVRDAIACKKERDSKRMICVSGSLRACGDWESEMLVECSPKGGHVFAARSGGMRAFIYMCFTISLPSSEVMQNPRGLVYPCRTDEGQLDAPMQSQSNLECWQRMRFAIPIYPCLRLPTQVMPAITLPPPIQYSLLYSQLPTGPWATRRKRERESGGGGQKQSHIYWM